MEAQKAERNSVERTACNGCKGGRPHLSMNDEPSADVEPMRVQEQQRPRKGEKDSEGNIEKDEHRWSNFAGQTWDDCRGLPHHAQPG